MKPYKKIAALRFPIVASTHVEIYFSRSVALSVFYISHIKRQFYRFLSNKMRCAEKGTMQSWRTDSILNYLKPSWETASEATIKLGVQLIVPALTQGSLSPRRTPRMFGLSIKKYFKENIWSNHIGTCPYSSNSIMTGNMQSLSGRSWRKKILTKICST